MRVIERLPWYLGGAFAIGLGVIAVAHTPLGKPLLSLAPGCPVDFSDSDKLERARVQALAAKRGTQVERTRPALEFELGKSTREHVEAALARKGGHCESERADTALRCSLPDAQMFAQFANDKLVALDLLRSAADSSRALAWLVDLEHTLSARVGEATAHFGSFDAAALRARFAQSIVEYRYANYVAQISALNTGNGIKLREQYQTF